MKWFKHDSHSLGRANIERLIMEFGIEGYGLYYACIEMIAGTIETNNITFELEHDAKIIAHKFKMDTLRVETIMHRCIEYGLFDMADSGKLRCLQLAKMIDDSTSKNPEFKKMQESLIESGLINSEKFRKIPKVSSQNRIEENRIEKKRIIKEFIPPTLEEIKKYVTDNNYRVNPDLFYKYFSEGNWFDSKGNKVKNWKQKIITWNSKDKLMNPPQKSYKEQVAELYGS